MMVPYGLQATVAMPGVFSRTLPGAAYDPETQVSLAAGQPVVEDPELLASWGVTWTDTNDPNEK